MQTEIRHFENPKNTWVIIAEPLDLHQPKQPLTGSLIPAMGLPGFKFHGHASWAVFFHSNLCGNGVGKRMKLYLQMSCCFSVTQCKQTTGFLIFTWRHSLVFSNYVITCMWVSISMHRIGRKQLEYRMWIYSVNIDTVLLPAKLLLSAPKNYSLVVGSIFLSTSTTDKLHAY